MREIKFGRPLIGDEEKAAVLDVLSGDILVHGPRAKKFESAFSDFTNGGHAVSVSSCTAGLHLSYFHLGIGEGDEVIVPAQSHVATVHAVEYVGATPVFVDSELQTGNIDLDQIEDKITDRTRAISIVHYLGMPVNMDKIVGLTQKYDLKLVEDCALAVGSKYKGKHAGLFGDTGCFSFYPVKHFTTAEGGMILCKNEKDAAILSRKRAFGVDRTDSERKVPGIYEVNMLGYNYRMNEIQAALGIVQLSRVQRFLDIRKSNYDHLRSQLIDISEIDLFDSTNGDFESSYYCMSLLLNDSLATKRFEIVKELNGHGIGTSTYYPKSIPEFEYYKQKYNHHKSGFVNAARISDHTIALPVGPHLNSDDMDYIASTLKGIIIHIK